MQQCLPILFRHTAQPATDIAEVHGAAAIKIDAAEYAFTMMLAELRERHVSTADNLAAVALALHRGIGAGFASRGPRGLSDRYNFQSIDHRGSRHGG